VLNFQIRVNFVDSVQALRDERGQNELSSGTNGKILAKKLNKAITTKWDEGGTVLASVGQ
jgi:hypothetical protein